MPDEFVKKEVFNARMDRMEALLEKTLIEMKADNEKLRSEVNAAINGMKAENEKLRSELKTEIRMLDTRVDALGSRIDTVQTTVYWGFAIIAIVLAFLPTIQDWRRMFHKPAVTMEDVERAINAAIAQARLEGK